MEDAEAGEGIGGLGEDFVGGAAGKNTDFEGAKDTVAVVGMDALGGFGVEAGEETREVGTLFETGAEGGVGSGAGGEAAEEGAEIEAGAAAEDGEATAGGDFGKEGFDLASEVGGGEGLVGTTNVEEMVRGGEAFGERKFGGADVEAAEDLERVTVYDFAVEVAGKGDGESAFARTGGADDSE